MVLGSLKYERVFLRPLDVAFTLIKRGVECFTLVIQI